jgi:hypothetical protein
LGSWLHLRHYSNTDSYTNTYSNTYTDSNANSYTYSNANSYSNTNTNSNSYTNTNAYPDTKLPSLRCRYCVCIRSSGDECRWLLYV